MRKTKRTMQQAGRRAGVRTMMNRLRREESGQSLVMVCVSMFVLLCVCALVVDLARAMDVQRQLQLSADAAALAAAENLGSSNGSTNYVSYGDNYTSNSGSKNEYNGITITSSTVSGECLTTVVGWGIPCTSSSPNAVQVTQTTQLDTYFAQILGIRTVNVSATSTASKGRPVPYNIALIVDTTPSMIDTDQDCGGKTQLQCALEGARQLLQSMNPSVDKVSLFTFPNDPTSGESEVRCNNGYAQSAGPYTFPPAGASGYTSMPYYTYTPVTTKTPVYNRRGQVTGYTTSTTYNRNETDETYEVVGFSDDYKSSSTTSTLDSSSKLVQELGGDTTSDTMQVSCENTYYAGAIYAAQAALLAEQTSRDDGSKNVIILLSDGNATAVEDSPNNGQWTLGSNDMATNDSDTSKDAETDDQYNMTSPNDGATSSGTYPSYVGQCGQGVDAAQAATNAGTLFITVAYGSPTSSTNPAQRGFGGGGAGYTTNQGNCSSDVGAGNHPNISPCQAMNQMASNYSTNNSEWFFSEPEQSGVNTGCQSPNTANNGSLSSLFDQIALSLSDARLIPNSTP